ncbi:hypothetical protein [Desulfosarcina variabilis]|uniref:hypothetical protein n=1 Tax=Desulfosarcina variabilis TaxID=2300 RepID=UPI003AFA71B2
MKVIKCPKCNQTQSIINAFACLKLWFDLKPVVWKCPVCNSTLSFTVKGILLFWLVCFPVAMGIVYLIFWEAIKNFPPLISLALMAILLLTFSVSFIFKNQIYKIEIGGEKGAK